VLDQSGVPNLADKVDCPLGMRFCLAIIKEFRLRGESFRIFPR
jgi:hypothetical protein